MELPLFFEKIRGALDVIFLPSETLRSSVYTFLLTSSSVDGSSRVCSQYQNVHVDESQRLGTALIPETDALLVNLSGIECWETLSQEIEEVTVIRWETVVAYSLKAINKVDPEVLSSLERLSVRTSKPNAASSGPMTALCRSLLGW